MHAWPRHLTSEQAISTSSIISKNEKYHAGPSSTLWMALEILCRERESCMRVNVKSLLLICFYATNIIKLNYAKASIEMSPAFFEMPNLITHFWATQATLATDLHTVLILYGNPIDLFKIKLNNIQLMLSQFLVVVVYCETMYTTMVFQPCAP